MFGFLKDKLKNWVKKAAPEEEVEEIDIEKTEETKSKEKGEKGKKEKKEKTKPEKKPAKEEKKEKPSKEAEKKKEKKKATIEEDIEEELEEEKPEESFIERHNRGVEKEKEEEKIEEKLEEEKAEELEKEKEAKEQDKEAEEEKAEEFEEEVEEEKEIEIVEKETPEEKEEEEKAETKIIPEKETPEEKSKEKFSFKKFFGFGKKEQKIEQERAVTDRIWEDIKETEEKFVKEKEEREEKSVLSFFKRKFTQEKFDSLFPELETALLQSNVSLKVVDEIRKKLEKEVVNQNISEDDLEKKLKIIIESLLLDPPDIISEIKSKIKKKSPFVISFVGINGSGKTTTIAKFANLLKKENLSVCLAAADTFRSAAIEQLSQHAERLEVPIIKKDYGADPASVGFDAIAYAKKHKIDVVLIDTAGRMQTKDSLMKEMEKIMRVCSPDMKIFVGESITGNDATEQAAAFNESISIDGLILSKADVDDKGGTALSVSFITGKPILFLGTGQTYDDLELFDKEKIMKNLGL